jgi:hypothetical protein
VVRLGPRFLDGLWNLSVLGGQLSRAAEQLTSCGPPTLSSDCGKPMCTPERSASCGPRGAKPYPKADAQRPARMIRSHEQGATCSHQHKQGHRTRRLKWSWRWHFHLLIAHGQLCCNQRGRIRIRRAASINNFWQARRTRDG